LILPKALKVSKNVIGVGINRLSNNLEKLENLPPHMDGERLRETPVKGGEKY
jgi:hypothetical protein